MKRTYIATVIVASVASVLFAQTDVKPQSSQEYIYVLGVKVRLGMTKEEISEKLGSQRLRDERSQTQDFWLFGEKREWPSSIEFKDGKVIYASESWIGPDRDVAKALFGAVTSLNKQGYSTCQIFTDTESTSSSLTAERVWINCGKKSILVQRMQDAKSTYQQVFERLGSPPADAE